MERDRATRARQPIAGHRCYREPERPIAIGEAHQTAFCLSDRYADCPAFPAGWSAPGGQGRGGWLRRRGIVMYVIAGGIVAGCVAAIAAGVLVRDGTRPGQEVSPPPSPTQATATAATTTPTPTPAATAEPTPSPTPTAVEPRTYTVVAGDSWALIAEQFDTSVAELMAANGVPPEVEILFAGMVVVIPDAAE